MARGRSRRRRSRRRIQHSRRTRSMHKVKVKVTPFNRISVGNIMGKVVKKGQVKKRKRTVTS